MVKKALGKGLGAIISVSQTPTEDIEKAVNDDTSRIVELDVEKVIPNPEQPRTFFDEHKLNELSDSIKSVGLIQPIIVKRTGSSYQVVAGERRLRAVKLAGLGTIKSIVIDASEEKQFSMALIENIQRSDLDPIEEARAYKFLISRFKLKQQDVGLKVGRDRVTVANSLRLLNLPEEIQKGLSEAKISTGHAKVLLSISGKNEQKKFFMEIIDKKLSVRELEKLINHKKNEKVSLKIKKSHKQAHIKKMEDKLISILGTKVEIKHSHNKGKIEISYYSLDDFDRIVEILK